MLQGEILHQKYVWLLHAALLKYGKAYNENETKVKPTAYFNETSCMPCFM